LGAERRSARRALRKVEQTQLLQSATMPPGRQANRPGLAGFEINPDAIVVDRRRQQLVEERQLQPISQVTGAFQLAEKIFDHIALGHNDDHRLQFAG